MVFNSTPEEQRQDRERYELFDAIERGDHPSIRKLFQLEKVSVSPDEVDGAGRTALYLAARDGSHECAWELLNAGANINAPSFDPEEGCVSPLNVALSNGHRKLAKALLGRRADPRIVKGDGKNALHLAVIMHFDESDANAVGEIQELIELCLNAGAPVNQPDIAGDTSLMLAVKNGAELQIVRMLLSRGANPLCADATGSQAIHEKWDRFSTPILRALAAAGADLNARDFFGRSPLSLATDIESIDVLLELGAEVNQLDYAGRTILVERLAARTPAPIDVLVHLVGSGLDLDKPSYTGETVDRMLQDRLSDDRHDQVALTLRAAIASVRAREAMHPAISGHGSRPA